MKNETTPVCDKCEDFVSIKTGTGEIRYLEISLAQRLERHARRNARWSWKFRKSLNNRFNGPFSITFQNEIFCLKKELHKANARIAELEIENPICILSEFFKKSCDGDHEHLSEIKIQATDNPGWLITIEDSGVSPNGPQSFKGKFDIESYNGDLMGYCDGHHLLELLIEVTRVLKTNAGKAQTEVRE